MEDNGHPFFDDLSRDTIEWEKITYDEIGLRGLDLVITAIAFAIITGGIFILARRQGISDYGTKLLTSIFAGSFLLSAFISYNRDTLTIPYYGIGYLLPVVFFATCFYSLVSKSITDDRRAKLNLALAVMFVLVIIFTETRLSAINIMMLFMLLTPVFLKPAEDAKSNTLIRLTFGFIIIPITMLSHYRILYWSAPRAIINLSIQQDFIPWLMNTGFIFAGILFYQYNTKTLDSAKIKYPVIALFTAIPTLMTLENNIVDWILLSAMLVLLCYAIYDKLTVARENIEIVTLIVFCWLTMSWGGYVGGISIILYVCFNSFFRNELNFLFAKSDNSSNEVARIMINTIFPLVVWFTWWAALGQINGLTHPRDVDPGSLYLNGGYIGDRFSPSNGWVGFMGGGPAVAMSMLWFSMLGKVGFNLKYVAYYLLARIGVLSMQLSLSPNLPRLIFKLSWDIIFSIGLLLFMSHIIVKDRIEKRKLRTIDAILL